MTSSEILRSLIQAYRSAKRRIALLADLALLLAAVLGGAGALFLADYALKLPESGRAALASLYALVLVAAVIRLAVRLSRKQSSASLAAEIERRSGRPFRATLVTAVELQGARDIDRFGYSRDLVLACIHEAARLAREVEPRSLADRERLRRSSRRLGAVALLTAAVALWGSDALAYVAGRYAAALGGKEVAGPVSFDVQPGDRAVAEGSEVDVRLRISGTDRFPRMLRGASGEVVALRHDGEGYAATLPAVTESFDYLFEAGPFRSRSYRITVVKPPALKRLTIAYRYPAYTGMRAERQEEGTHDLVGPVGTIVELSGESTTPLTSAAIVLDGKRTPAKLTGPAAFRHELEIRRNGSYSVELFGAEGFGNRPASYHITAVEDRVPLVYLLEPGKDLSLAVTEMTTFPLKVFATDDYAIQSLTLHYTLAQRSDFQVLTADYTETIPLPQGDSRKMTVSHLWDLSRKVFQPGDVVTYFAEAVDRMPADKPHAGRSKTYTIRIPFITDVAQETSSEQEEQISTVEDLAKKQKEIDDKLAQAMKDIQKQEGQVDWKTRQEIETLSKKQQAVKKRAEEVASKMQATLDKMQKNDIVDAGTLEKLKEVQDLFNQVADSRMKELMERMRDLMTQTKMEPLDISKAQKEFDKSRYARELDRVLASLKKLKVEQEMQNVTKTLAETAKKQEQLRQQTEQRLKEGKPVDDLKGEQRQLQDQTEKLMKRMEGLASDAEKPFPDVARDVKEAVERAKKEGLQQDVKQAADHLAQNQGEQAQERQNQALNKLRAMQDSMQQTQAGMKKKQAQVNLAKLLSLTRYALDISREQETLASTGPIALDEMLGDVRELSRGLAAVQGRVHHGLESFERGFNDLIADEVLFKSAFVSAVSELMDSSKEALDAFEATHIHSGRQLAAQNLEKLNRVVAKLMEMIQQLMNQQQQGGMEGFFDQLEKLVEQQQKLNEQAERLKQEPQSNPLLQEMMQRMAMQQMMIRQAMEQLAQKYQEAKEVMGDLEGVAKEMKEVEEALKKFDNSDQTRAKQQKILYRMLEAEKSLHKQGESKKREAKFARDYAPTQVNPVERELTEVRQKLFHNLSRESYPVEHRELVERYLRSIAQ